MKSWLLLFACNLMWALQFTCIKLVQDQVGAMFTVWGPMTLSMLMLIPFVMREKAPRPKVPRRTVVLTYLAFGEGLAPNSGAQPEAHTVRRQDLPRIATTDPDTPSPPTIKDYDVLAHGLRHLALLARRTGNDLFTNRLGPRSRKFFASIQPEVPGEIRDGLPLDRAVPQGQTGQ